MKRIFYYSGYRLTVFHWNNEKLMASYAFNPGEDGFEKFRTYLLATENTPARILVDLIEEDFKKESIPHVGAIDRKSIVSRLVERHYRKSRDYFHSTVLERETHGRKDDVLLYSVLSNPEIIEPWLKVIRETATNISGIWSLPLISHRLLRKLNETSTNVILVSQQVPSNLRQSFFKNGRFEISRSAVVNLDEANISEHISTEVEQTIRFLSNQRQVGFDEIIEVHILCREEDVTEIKSHCSDTNLLHFHYHDLAKVTNLIKCDTQKFDYCSAIYSYICASEKIPVGHYGHSSLFFKFYEYLFSKTLYVASALIFILSIILSFSFISDSSILDNETVTLNSKAANINKEYRKTLSQLEKKLSESQMMQSSVLFTQKVNATKSISPQNFMVDVSHILGAPGLHRANITMIKWQQNQSNNFPVVETGKKSHLIDYGKTSPINQAASISGFINLSQSSLKKSVETTNALAAAFKQHKNTIKLNIDRVPVDIRPQSSIENEAGSNSKVNSSSAQSKGQFEINLLMKSRIP